MFDFRFNTPIPSLNQDQESVFMFRECAQSIPRLEKPRNRRFSHKNPKMFDFRFNTPISSLNQGQGSVFKVRGCAQSTPRLEKPKNRRFSHKNPKMYDFRFNTSTPFPESGSRKRFHASGMRGIDFSHKITPNNVFFTKIFKKIFFRRTGSDCYPSPL